MNGADIRLYVELFYSVFTQGSHTAFFSNEPNLLSNIRRTDCSYVVAVMHRLITGKDEDNNVEE